MDTVFSASLYKIVFSVTEILFTSGREKLVWLFNQEERKINDMTEKVRCMVVIIKIKNKEEK
jgi:hypothetical protein